MTAGKEGDHTDRSVPGQNTGTALAEREQVNSLEDVRKISRPNATADDTVTKQFGAVEWTDSDGTDTGKGGGTKPPPGEKPGTTEKPSTTDQPPLTPEQLEELTAQIRAQVVAEEQNVSVEAKMVNGKMTYTFYTDVEGKRKDILTTDNPNYREEIEQYQEKKIKELEDKYKIDIAGDDETFEHNGDTFNTRTPNLSELTALEEGLKYSVPSNLTRSGDPLRVVFSESKVIEGATAYFSAPDDVPIIVFQPNSGTRSVDTQIETVTHEFAHHGDWEARENLDGNWWERLPIQEAFLNAQLGYVKDENGRWLIKGKEDGEFFRYDKKLKEYIRTNKEGDLIDADGNVVEKVGEAERLSRDEMRDRALVKPPTDYFPNPEEIWAEVQTYYRAGPERRAELYEMNPELYRLAKKFDQQEINVFYPPREDGSPSYIRLPSGEVVPNTPKNASTVLAYEVGLHRNIATNPDRHKPGNSAGGLKRLFDGARRNHESTGPA